MKKTKKILRRVYINHGTFFVTLLILWCRVNNLNVNEFLEVISTEEDKITFQIKRIANDK